MLGKMSGRNVREVPAPWVVVNAHTIAVALDVQSGQRRDDPVAHERRRAHRAVVRAGDGVPDAGIDAEEPIARRNGSVSLDDGRLTSQAQQVIGEATCARHLVHDAAWCAGDVILGPLRRDGNLRGSHVHAVRGGNGVGEQHAGDGAEEDEDDQ